MSNRIGRYASTNMLDAAVGIDGGIVPQKRPFNQADDGLVRIDGDVAHGADSSTYDGVIVADGLQSLAL